MYDQEAPDLRLDIANIEGRCVFDEMTRRLPVASSVAGGCGGSAVEISQSGNIVGTGTELKNLRFDTYLYCIDRVSLCFGERVSGRCGGVVKFSEATTARPDLRFLPHCLVTERADFDVICTVATRRSPSKALMSPIKLRSIAGVLFPVEL